MIFLYMKNNFRSQMQRFDTLNPINHNLARPIVFMFYDDDDQQYKYIIIFIFISTSSGAEQQTSFAGGVRTEQID